MAHAVTLLKGLIDESPKNPGYRQTLAMCYRDNYPDVRPHDPVRAAESLDRATEILEQLVRDYPQIPDYRYDLCQCYAMVDPPPPPHPGPPGLQRDPGRVPREDASAVEGRLDKALNVAQTLASQYPHVPEYLALQAQVHHKLGGVFRQTGRWNKAEKSDREALACQQALVQRVPGVTAYEVLLSAFRNSLADILLLNDKPQEAAGQIDQTIAMLNDLLEANPDAQYLHGALTNAYRTDAEILRATGRNDQAAQARKQADKHRLELDRHVPGSANRSPPPVILTPTN